MEAESNKPTKEAENSKQPLQEFELSALSFQLKIGFDGKRAANNLTGLGNYSRSLIELLVANFPKNQYFIYTPKVKDTIKKLVLFNKNQVYLKLPPKGKSKLFWRSWGINKQLVKDEIDLFHGLSHEIPVDIQHTGIKTLVTIHDLIFIRQPQYYKWIDRLIYRFKSKYACKHADRIIAISEKTKADIVDLYQINPSKIDVVYQSCDDSFKTLVPTAEKEKIAFKYNLPTRYLLYVGTIEARKNLLNLVRALAKVDPTYTLVVVGKETDYAEKVKQELINLNITNRVLFLKNIPFSDLPAIYQLASIFVLPSYYEGFGIPIIEALYGNIPVIAATGSCLEEAGGPASIYINPDDSQELANAINKVIIDPELQENMKQKGLAYVQKFNNEVVSENLMNSYRNTLTQ